MTLPGRGTAIIISFIPGSCPALKVCSKVRSFKGVWSYASKYLGKTFQVDQWGKLWTGRFWGVGHKENIPFGELKEFDISYREANTIMRYQRRYMRRYKTEGKGEYKRS